MICVSCKREIPDKSAYCNFCGKKQSSPARLRKRFRGSGEGSCYRVGQKWRVEIVLGYKSYIDEDGVPRLKRLTHTKYGFDKKQDALAYIAAYQSGAITPSNRERHNYDITLRQLYDEWFAAYQTKVSKSTINCYKSGFKIFTAVADLPMRDQNIDDLQDCIDSSGKGRRTQENARTALGLVYKHGIPRNCIPHDRNLAQFLRISGEYGNRTTGLNDFELDMIRRMAASGHYGAILILCNCYLGFRPTAFIGLTRIQYDPVHRAFTAGIKTDAGKDRTVTVSPKIQPYLDALLSRPGTDYIFCSPEGQPFTPSSYRDLFYSTIEEAGIDNPVDTDGRHRVTPHSCRHTFATLLKRVSGSDKDKLELIGHTSADMLRYYQDVDYADLRQITDAL